MATLVILALALQAAFVDDAGAGCCLESQRLATLIDSLPGIVFPWQQLWLVDDLPGEVAWT